MGLLSLFERCDCARLPAIFNVGRRPNRLKRTLVEVGLKAEEWVRLFKCSACGQHWQLDEWDRYQTVCAIKIEDATGWRTFSDRSVRIGFLVDSRGGLSEGPCAMARCGGQALKSLAYCPEHAYELGLRE
jgi:hypothetical protein